MPQVRACRIVLPKATAPISVGQSSVIYIRIYDLNSRSSAPQMQPHDDILVIISETAAEDIDAARTLRLLLDADLQADRVVVGEVQLIERHARHADAVDEAAFVRDGPGRQLAVLRALELPPARRELAPPVAEIARRDPRADEGVVDPEANIRGPVRI